MEGSVVEKSSTLSQSESNHHVKFHLLEEERKMHHENLEITELEENLYKVNLGYLKVDHYYKASFGIKHEYKEVNLAKEESSDHVTLKELKHEDGKLNFTFIFYAFKEKLDEEEVFFDVKTVNNKNESLKFKFEAKVLGANQGTPLLRNGITLLRKKTLSEDSNHFNVI